MELRRLRSYTGTGLDFAFVRKKQCADRLFFNRHQLLTSFRFKARSSNQSKATAIVSQEPRTNTPRK